MSLGKLWTSIAALALFVRSSDADLYCAFESRKAYTLDCMAVGERFNYLASPEDFGVVEAWNEVEVMMIRGGNVIFISDNVFSNAKYVQHLDLSFNQFDVNAGMFSSMASLRSLNLSSISLSILDPDTFKGLDELKELDLSHNLLSLEEDTPAALNSLTSLRALDISYNLVNNMTTLTLGSKLRTFIASDVGITVLNKNSFSDAGQLAKVVFSRTNLLTIPNGLFDACPSLTLVDLSFNKINSTGLPAKLFSYNANLSMVDLSRNRLTTLSDPALFSSNPSLITLDLSSNKITLLHARLFAANRELLVLKMDANQIAKLPTGIFDSLEKLQHLDLSNNVLVALPNGVFTKNVNLDSLSLIGNSFKVLNQNTFQSNVLLRILHLSRNKLEQFPIQLISHLKELILLDLAHNRLSSVPPELLYLQSLVHVWISCNNLTYLPASFFQVQELTAESGAPTVNKVVALHGNPWQCACLNALLETAQQNVINYHLEYLADGKSLTCVIGVSPSICTNVPLQKKDLAHWEQTLKLYPQTCR